MCYLRVPAWASYPLQFYRISHGPLMRSLRPDSIELAQEDNAFCVSPTCLLRRCQPILSILDNVVPAPDALCPITVPGGRCIHLGCLVLKLPTCCVLHRSDVSHQVHCGAAVRRDSRWTVLASAAPRVAGLLGKKVTLTLPQESRFAQYRVPSALTMADAMLDRLKQNHHRFRLTGESLCKTARQQKGVPPLIHHGRQTTGGSAEGSVHSKTIQFHTGKRFVKASLHRIKKAQH
jgi:hypothetical protein